MSENNKQNNLNKVSEGHKNFHTTNLSFKTVTEVEDNKEEDLLNAKFLVERLALVRLHKFNFLNCQFLLSTQLVDTHLVVPQQ